MKMAKLAKRLIAAAGLLAGCVCLTGAEQTVDTVTVADGEIFDVIWFEGITTSGAVKIEDGGASFFWSAEKVTLNPGFEALEGSYFMATIDSDLDGWTDLEEATDTDDDGIPDAWETTYGLDPNDGDDASGFVSYSTQFIYNITYLEVYMLGMVPGAGDPSSGGTTVNLEVLVPFDSVP